MVQEEKRESGYTIGKKEAGSAVSTYTPQYPVSVHSIHIHTPSYSIA